MSGWAHPHLPNQGKSNEWYTPPAVFAALGLRFDLDPCAPPLPAADWIPAAHRYTCDDDGLALPWEGRVWLNPPYGREAAAWMRRMRDHGNGVALVFSRTDVKWWHDVAPSASAVCFIRGRLTFIAGAGQSAPGNSGGPSALLAWGDVCADALSASGLGLTYRAPSVPAPKGEPPFVPTRHITPCDGSGGFPPKGDGILGWMKCPGCENCKEATDGSE